MAAEGPLSASELLNTLLGRDVLRNAFLAKMEKFPILLCPVCAVPAFRHGEREWMVAGRKMEYLKAMAYSQWFNLLGNPGGGGAGGEIARGIADWGAGGGAAVGRRS